MTPTPEARIAESVRLFVRAAEARKLPMSGDLRVTERGAADLLGISEGGLRALRASGDGPPAVRLGVGGSRLSYSIVALATWIESLRDR